MPAGLTCAHAYPYRARETDNTTKRKKVLFENVFVGESFGPVEFLADEHHAKAYAFAIDDYSPWYFEDAGPFGGRIFPSAAVVDYLVGIYHEKYDFNDVVSLHQREEVRHCRPIPIGAKLVLTGAYVDKFEKRGKGYATLEANAHDVDGTLYVQQRSTEVIRISSDVTLGEGSAEAWSRRVSGEWPTDRPAISSFRPGVAVGTPILPLSKEVYQDQMTVYSGRGEFKRNIHTDDSFARSHGLPRTLAQGMMEHCYLSQYLASFFGAAWLETGWSDIAFLKPVFAGDRLTCFAVVTGMETTDAGSECEVETWIRNEDGHMTAAGWARCTVRR